jgi:hypothetical protein
MFNALQCLMLLSHVIMSSDVVCSSFCCCNAFISILLLHLTTPAISSISAPARCRRRHSRPRAAAPHTRRCCCPPRPAGLVLTAALGSGDVRPCPCGRPSSNCGAAAVSKVGASTRDRRATQPTPPVLLHACTPASSTSAAHCHPPCPGLLAPCLRTPAGSSWPLGLQHSRAPRLLTLPQQEQQQQQPRQQQQPVAASASSAGAVPQPEGHHSHRHK